MDKARCQQPAEFLAAQFLDMERINAASGERINVAVWRTDNELSIRPQYSADFVQEVLLGEKMFDCLKRSDNVETAIRQFQPPRIALGEVQVIPPVGKVRVFNSLAG